jgi:hypothetical protein
MKKLEFEDDSGSISFETSSLPEHEIEVIIVEKYSSRECCSINLTEKQVDQLYDWLKFVIEYGDFS